VQQIIEFSLLGVSHLTAVPTPLLIYLAHHRLTIQLSISLLLMRGMVMTLLFLFFKIQMVTEQL